MKFNKGYTLVLALLMVAFLVTASFAQETTAGLQGLIKDPQGAVVSKATVEVSGPAMIGVKKSETDASGYYRFANLPPGTYTITVTAQGFRTTKQTGVTLNTGALPTIDLKLEIGGVEQTVEVSSAAPLVDVATSKVQTNISEDVLNAVPKGRSFQSVIQFAPGARSEPLQGGYQIDGASNSENAYLVEGQDTGSVRTGASAANVPMEFIQEVQVKTSGFEAEYGGALGGVVNVIQKRGGNAWHGSVFTSYRGDIFDAAPAKTLRKDPNQVSNQGHSLSQFNSDGSANANWCGLFTTPQTTCRLDAPYQYYQAKKDHYRILDPGFEVGGYVKKDRLWVFASFVPDFQTTRRTMTFVTGAPTVGPQTFNQQYQTYYSMARVDYLATHNIRVYGSWQLGYQRANGIALPNADDAYGLYNASSKNAITNYEYSRGYVAPNTIYNTGADITITPNIVATTRFGYFFTDYQDRGIPQGIRYIFGDSNYNYPAVSGVGAKSLQGTSLPIQFQQPGGYSSLGANTGYQYDKFRRKSFSQDIAWFKKGFGTHNIKAGYSFNRLENNVYNGPNTADVYVAYQTPYKPLASNYGVCQGISTQNNTLYGNTGVGLLTDPTSDASTGKSCMGLWGTVNFTEFGTIGLASSYNHAIYVQDSWTVGQRLTMNLGMRFDKESLPSFAAGFPGINFGFGQKAAPRLGASYDVFGNGKLKVYGSFGYFYDIMKYELPRGSFGGDYWHDCVYAMDTPDYTTLVPQTISGHYCPPTGGATGTINNARFIENQNFRTTSNDPNAPGSLGATGYIDPNLKPMKQHEMVIGADYALTSQFAFETRYSRKRLDRTIEDAGQFTPAGEQYYIVNPGFGVDHQPVAATDCTNCPFQPPAARRYDGVEFRLVRRPGAGKWFGAFSYTYSKLMGNYSGLTSSDVSDSGTASPGRSSPNVDRNYDEPYMQFDANGKVVDGPLATDRPNTFKAYGYYRLKWWGHETLVGGYQQWYSGTPLSSYISVDGAPVFVEGRGKWVNLVRDTTGIGGTWINNGVSNRRTPQFAQTDLSIVQNFHVSKSNEKLVLGVEGNVTNLFNQHAATVFNQSMISSGSIAPDVSYPPTSISQTDYYTLMTGYNYIATANSSSKLVNSLYGQVAGWQTPRQIRFKVGFSF